MSVKSIRRDGWTWGIPRPLTWDDHTWVVRERLRRKLLRYPEIHEMDVFSLERLIRALRERILQLEEL